MAKSGWKESGIVTSRWPASCALLLLAGFLFAQDTIRVNVNLVNITATVRNAKGELVGSLGKDDFEIFDNGVRQEIAILQRQSERALSVALLVDTSGSTAKDLKYETDSAARFLRTLLVEGQPDDAASLFSFNWRVTEERPFTHNYASLERTLKSLQGEAGTSAYDALYFASRALESRSGRKAIVIVTDGGDTVSKYTLKQALEAAQLADAVIYAILVQPITNDAGRNIGGENALTILTRGTGGRVFLPGLNADLDRAFSDIMAELRTQYLLGFYPRHVPLTENRYHTLEVRAKSPDLRVSARTGYYGESDAPGGGPASRNSVSPGKTKQLQEK
jgi:Ca-activated chloride channel homolog